MVARSTGTNDVLMRSSAHDSVTARQDLVADFTAQRFVDATKQLSRHVSELTISDVWNGKRVLRCGMIKLDQAVHCVLDSEVPFVAWCDSTSPLVAAHCCEVERPRRTGVGHFGPQTKVRAHYVSMQKVATEADFTNSGVDLLAPASLDVCKAMQGIGISLTSSDDSSSDKGLSAVMNRWRRKILQALASYGEGVFQACRQCLRAELKLKQQCILMLDIGPSPQCLKCRSVMRLMVSDLGVPRWHCQNCQATCVGRPTRHTRFLLPPPGPQEQPALSLMKLTLSLWAYKDVGRVHRLSAGQQRLSQCRSSL